MRLSHRIYAAAAAALAVAGLSLTARADYVFVYGGLTYDPSSGNGYSSQTETFPSTSAAPGGETVGTGVGVGSATVYASNAAQGSVAQRLTTTGASVLNGLGGYDFANATDAAGDAVGYSYLSAGTGNRRATYWAASNATPVTLNSLNGNTIITSASAPADQASYITTSSINNNALRIYGQATLYSADGTTSLGTRAVRWDSSGNVTQLGNIGTSTGTAAGTTFARAFSANSADTAVGYAFAYNAGTALGYRAVRWDASGNATQLGDVVNNDFESTTQNILPTAALSVNAKGDAVGFGPTYDSNNDYLGNRAIVWKAGTTAAIELTTPATFSNFGIDGSANDYAYKINANGEAVGSTTVTSNSNFRATRWDTSTGADTILGDLTTFSTASSVAYDVNDAGIVAGDIRDTTANNAFHAVVWGTNDQPVDLNTLINPSSGWNLQTVGSISNTDWVSGTGLYTPSGSSTSYTRDFLLQLPASLVSSGPANLTYLNANGAFDNGLSASFNGPSGATVFHAGDNVTFDDTRLGGPYTVPVSGMVSPGSTTFNNSQGNYVLTGTNTSSGITGTGTLIKYGTGSVSLSLSNSYTGGTIVNAGKLIFASANAYPVNTSLNIASGAMVTIANHGIDPTYLAQLSALTNSGTIDVTNNSLIVHNGLLSTISGQVARAFANGSWNGTSASNGVITSSVAASDAKHLTAVGVASGLSTFEGMSVTPTDVLVKYTYYGDANLDGKVDSSDYSRIDNGYLQSLTGWQSGDFNYDGIINGSDYTLIDNAFNTQGVQISAIIASSTAQFAGSAGTSSVPEPATLSVFAIAALGLVGRPRRK